MRKGESMTRLKIEDIKALNVEVSAKCNANCPFCSRKQKVRPYGEYLLTLADFKLLPISFIRQLRRISFGGNFGDLCCNPEFVDIAAYIRRLHPDIILEGNTNGSFQDAAWWQALGAFFQKGAMVFSLDGLQDTHRLHRKGTDFHTIVRNLRAFVAGGGVAHWQFIAFKHNEHQIREAEALAGEIGCARFVAIPSRDFNENLQPPETFDFRIKREVFAAYRDRLKGFDKQAVCMPLANGTLYIAADGTVHPCCFAHLMVITEHNEKFRFIVPLVKKYEDQINFKTRSIEEIISGPYFEEVLEKSRQNAYCVTKCNKFRKQIRKDLIQYDRFF